MHPNDMTYDRGKQFTVNKRVYTVNKIVSPFLNVQSDFCYYEPAIVHRDV